MVGCITVGTVIAALHITVLHTTGTTVGLAAINSRIIAAAITAVLVGTVLVGMGTAAWLIAASRFTARFTQAGSTALGWARTAVVLRDSACDQAWSHGYGWR
jgi:hypothetical protein